MREATDRKQKQEARRRYREIRARLGDEGRRQADAFVCMHVQELVAWQEATLVCSYLSVRDEVDTRALIAAAWAAGKEVALPRCVPQTRRMRWYRVRDLSSLERGAFGIEEPAEDPACEVDVLGATRALALVPGLVFDRKGYRLGYGGGYYDGFLAAFGGTSVGLARELLLVDDLAAMGLRRRMTGP